MQLHTNSWAQVGEYGFKIDYMLLGFAVVNTMLTMCLKLVGLMNLKYDPYTDTWTSGQTTKMESALFVPAKLTFSEYLRCLNFPLWTFWTAKTKQVKESNLFWDKAHTRSGKFKHLKFSENINFAGTNSVLIQLWKTLQKTDWVISFMLLRIKIGT